jgi:dTDP-4-amino-4,6-dideoxygalactose transaminase
VNNPFDAVRAFEAALCEYAGAKYACATTSCTDALLVACAYLNVSEVEIPRRTFVGVGQAILNAGGSLRFRDEPWSGGYQLKPYPIYDMARRTRAGMFIPGSFMCVSFHASKICGFTDGGAILYDDDAAHGPLHQMCYDGRPVAGVSEPWHKLIRGFHAYMAPDTAAGIHRKLAVLPRENADLPWDDYPDLSKLSIFGGNVAKSIAEAAE